MNRVGKFVRNAGKKVRNTISKIFSDKKRRRSRNKKQITTPGTTTPGTTTPGTTTPGTTTPATTTPAA